MNMHKYGYFESKIVISFEFLHILKNRRSTLKLYIYKGYSGQRGTLTSNPRLIDR
jgi:hypothetical protein